MVKSNTSLINSSQKTLTLLHDLARLTIGIPPIDQDTFFSQHEVWVKATKVTVGGLPNSCLQVLLLWLGLLHLSESLSTNTPQDTTKPKNNHANTSKYKQTRLNYKTQQNIRNLCSKYHFSSKIIIFDLTVMKGS